jgi:RNase P protein component
VLAAPRDRSLRAARHWLSMIAAWTPDTAADGAAAVRFGVTVGRRNARRSVDRALVKRVVREASRHAAAGLQTACASRQLRLDVAFRLKTSRDRPGTGTGTGAGAVSVAAWRRQLRREADALLERLAQHLAQLPA